MTGLKLVVVDDEPIAREGLATLLRREAGIATVLECASRDEAIAVLNREQPDAVFLDVQLSPGTGFEVVARADAPATQVIFVTAFDQHAVEAFSVAALDYVVKPVDPGRLRESVARMRERVRQVDGARSHESRRMPLVFHDGSETLVFQPRELSWVEGADDYARLHARGRSWLIRETMDSLAERLPSPPFHRVHRSAIVNIDHVASVQRESRHRHAAVLRDGTKVPLTTSTRDELERLLGRRGS